MSVYIFGISKPSNKEPEAELIEGFVLDAELLDRVFKVPITTVKCIPRGCCLAFSQVLKIVLCKVLAQPDSVNTWVKLLLFPRCTLQEKDDGITTLVKNILDGSALGSFGHGGAVVKVLSSFGVASYCDDTILALEAKHPYKPPPFIPRITFYEPPLIAEIDSVFVCIKSFSKGTSCKRDGLGAQHILDALCGEGSPTATNLLRVITSVVNLWLAGRCPPILAEFVAPAFLTPLFKPDNRIRPIAVGNIWRRLVFKVAMKGVGKEMSKYLSDFQFGVGVSGGAEVAMKGVGKEMSKYLSDFQFGVGVSGGAEHLTLRIDQHYSTRVQQGDPLRPLLFSLILHPLLHKIKDSCKLLLHAWYLNNGIIIGDSEEVVRVLDIIKVSGPCLGLELNIKKTEIFWPSCNGMKLQEGLFPVDIRRPSSVVKLLGGAVSRDTYFISGLAMRRSANAVDLMSLLPQTCQPVHMEEATLFFDKASRAQYGVLQDHILRDSGICDMEDDYNYALAYLRDTISSFDFSDFTNKDTTPLKLNKHWRMSILVKWSRIWKLGQHMSPVEYRTILKYRLMIPLFPVDAICPVCRKACLDSFGEHAVHCKELSGFKYRHDMVRTSFFYICRRVGIFAKKEAPANFLTDMSDGRSTLRPTDVLVFGWVGGKHACVDLIGVSPLVVLSSRGFTTCKAALKAASCKATKYEKACIENQHVFIPFAFDTFGFLAPEAVVLLSRVQRVMHKNVMIHRSMDVVLNVLALQFKKG
nr:putative reverse transcriptase domain-containing protein [Tanacetum cinerariifolium]